MITNNAEGGSNGTSATAGNTGGASGDAFAAVSLSGASTCTFSGEQAAHGAMSYKMGTNGTDVQYLEWLPTTASSAAARVYFYFPSLPTSANGVVRVLTAGGGTTLMHLLVTNMQVEIQNTAAAKVWDSAGVTVPVGQWLRCEFSIPNGNTATGTMRMDWYAADSTTPIAGLSANITAQNFGTANIGRMRVGRTAAYGTLASFYVDDIGYQDGSTTYLGPALTGVAPTFPAELPQDSYAQVDLSGVTFDVGPGSFTVSPSTGVLITGTDAYLPTPATGSTVYTITATDTGNSKTATKTVAVNAPSGGDHVEMVVYDGSTWA